MDRNKAEFWSASQAARLSHKLVKAEKGGDTVNNCLKLFLVFTHYCYYSYLMVLGKTIAMSGKAINRIVNPTVVREKGSIPL